jgi:hypothetical protein
MVDLIVGATAWNICRNYKLSGFTMPAYHWRQALGPVQTKVMHQQPS